VRTTTLSVVMVTLAAVAVSSGCIKKEEKQEDNKAGPPPAPPPPPPEPARSALAVDQNAKYTAVAVASGKCLQFGGRGMNEQALAEIATCDKSPAQQFKLQPVPGNYWTLVSVLSGKCLDIQAISSDDGALAQQFTCNAGQNQQWIIADADAPGTIRLVARHSVKALDLKDSGTADGTRVLQMATKATPSQQFKLTPVAAETSAAAAKGGGTMAAGAGDAGGKTKKDKKEKPEKAEKPGKTKTP
jgi:ricin-type beta-trefoil lectin protein